MASQKFRLMGVLLFFALGILNCRAAYDKDQPLKLTPYLENNQIPQAIQLSRVDNTLLGDYVPPSHSGFFTVNKKLGLHMFFWFFPSPSNSSAPLVLWINGGPLVSAMIGLFYEHGPMAMDKNATASNPTYHKRAHTWVGPFSMLYVDNPANTGFSYSDTDYDPKQSTEDNATKNLFSVLEQFLTMFPEYKSRGIYIGGQSYAGMFTISLAHYIHMQSKYSPSNINMTGIHLGGPYFDPERQAPKLGEFRYQIGHLSYKAYTDFKKNISSTFRNAKCRIKKGLTTTKLYDILFPWSFNNFVTKEKIPHEVVSALMNTTGVKQSVHAGKNNNYYSFNDPIMDTYIEDAVTSRLQKLAVVLDNYKVMIYNGNLDLIIAGAGIDESLRYTPWSMQKQFNEAPRFGWGTNRLMGFYSHVGKFCRVTIDGAGHMAPYDQPEAALHAMERFVKIGCLY